MLNEVAYTAIPRWKSSFKLLHFEHRVHAYILDAGIVLDMAESPSYLVLNHLCFNGNTVQYKRT